MTDIEECCTGMRTLKEEGTIQPFTAFGNETAQVYMRSIDGGTRHYNEVQTVFSAVG